MEEPRRDDTADPFADEHRAKGDQPIDEPVDDDAQDISPEMQEEIAKLETAVWHAPRGPMTKAVAWIILVLLFLSIATITVLAIIGALGQPTP